MPLSDTVLFQELPFRVLVEGVPDLPPVGLVSGELWRLDNQGQGPGSTMVTPLFQGVRLTDSSALQLFEGRVNGGLCFFFIVFSANQTRHVRECGVKLADILLPGDTSFLNPICVEY